MTCYIRLSFLFFLVFFGISAHAQENPTEHHSIERLLVLANEKKLSSSKQWLRLLHYNQGGTLHSRNKSYADSSNFFISPKGMHDADEELKENILAFFSDSPDLACKFPARYQWLSEQLELSDYQNGLKDCELFLKVQNQVAAKKLVMVFPSAYMNSASSIFGHALFRIDTSEDDESVILNWAINYGAKLDTNDNSFEYAFKGMGGLYKGRYFVVPYSQKIKEYGQMENRDIWEYPLTLDQREIDFLIAHLWELKDIDFDYFFFDENCSYRLLELLEVARPELELTEKLRLTEIPLNTVKILQENNLIEGEEFRPSKESLLKAQLLLLNKEEKNLSEELANPEKNLEITLKNQTYSNASPEQQLALLDNAYDLVRFKQAQKERDQSLAKRSLDLLSIINTISIENPHVEKTQLEIDSESILETHDSHRLKLSAGRIKDVGNFTKLQYRMAYHDLIDNSWGFINGSHIEGPEVTFTHFEDESFIDSWQLVDIVSLTPITRLRKDLSWNLSIQGQKSEEAKQHMSSYLQAGGGFAFQYHNWIHYQMLSPRIENNSQYEQDVQAGINYNAGLLHDRGKHASLLQFSYIKLEQENALKKVELSQQIELSRNQALRLKLLSLRQDNLTTDVEQDSAEISYLLYF